MTNRQNVVFRGLDEAGLAELYAGLEALGLGQAGAELARDVVSCPGADTCNLAVTQSRGLASAIDTALEDAGLADVPGVRVNISGCSNSCGQHHTADIGFFGVERRAHGQSAPGYQLLLGGHLGDAQVEFGRKALRLPAKACAEATVRLVGRFAAERDAAETFSTWLDRAGGTAGSRHRPWRTWPSSPPPWPTPASTSTTTKPAPSAPRSASASAPADSRRALTGTIWTARGQIAGPEPGLLSRLGQLVQRRTGVTRTTENAFPTSDKEVQGHAHSPRSSNPHRRTVGDPRPVGRHGAGIGRDFHRRGQGGGSGLGRHRCRHTDDDDQANLTGSAEVRADVSVGGNLSDLIGGSSWNGIVDPSVLTDLTTVGTATGALALDVAAATVGGAGAGAGLPTEVLGLLLAEVEPGGAPGVGLPNLGLPGLGLPNVGLPGLGLPGLGLPGLGLPNVGLPGPGLPTLPVRLPSLVLPSTLGPTPSGQEDDPAVVNAGHVGPAAGPATGTEGGNPGSRPGLEPGVVPAHQPTSAGPSQSVGGSPGSLPRTRRRPQSASARRFRSPRPRGTRRAATPFGLSNVFGVRVLYAALADLVVMAHFGYLAVMVFGGLAARRWPRLLGWHIATAVLASERSMSGTLPAHGSGTALPGGAAQGAYEGSFRGLRPGGRSPSG